MHRIAAFIITHGDVASALKDALEKITGAHENIFTYSNKSDALPVLRQKILEQKAETAAEHTVIFVDFAGGSCWALGAMIQKEFEDVRLVGGVNLPMLVSFFTNQNQMEFDPLIKKIANDGRRGIVVQPEVE